MAISLYLDLALGATDGQQNPALQLNAQLLGKEYVQNFKQSIVLSLQRATTIAGAQQLKPLASFIQRAELIIGHNIHRLLQLILLEASRVGDQELISLLTPPRFGYDGGERVAVCLRQLATEYFDLVGWPPGLHVC